MVNDVLDIKLIEQGVIEKKQEAFCLQNIFDFVVAIFKP